jgi:hypothetical protein
LTGASYAGRPGFARLRQPSRPPKALRPRPTPYPGHHEYAAQAASRRFGKTIEALDAVLREICKRRGFTYVGSAHRVDRDARRYQWITPNGRLHHVDIDGCYFVIERIEKIGDHIVEAIDATKDTAHDRAGVREGAGELL